MYKECFIAATKDFLRKQSKKADVSHDTSYFFNTHTSLPTPKKSLPEVAERETKGLIYSAISKLIGENKVNPLKSLHVNWEEFKNFSAMQIVGLMLLKKEKMDEVNSELFPPIFPASG